MDGTQNTADHHGGGFKNVIAGIEHFPGHVIEALHDGGSFLSRIVNSEPAQEIAGYEKTHGKEQLVAIEKAGLDEYEARRKSGVKKAAAIEAAIVAAFECGVPEVKSLSTLAMSFLLSAGAAQLGL